MAEMHTPSLAPEDRVLQDPAGPFRDYVLRDYEPVCDPTGRLHPASILRWFLRTRGLYDGLWPIIERIVAHLGPGETVWGIKRMPDGRAAAELYFYGDQGRTDPAKKRLPALTAALEGLVAIPSRLDPAQQYVMCSLELDAEVARTGRSPGWRVYVPGTRPKHGWDGVSYLVAADAIIRENSYCFYYVPRELPIVRERVRHSTRMGGDVAGLLPPAFTDCFTLCFAEKARADALYFSRLSTPATVAFLERWWPGELAGLMARHADELAHLRWDLGQDVTAPSGDLSAINGHKVGLYGVI